jgi:hypothetical protein
LLRWGFKALWCLVAGFLLLFHSFPFRIKIKMLRIVKTAGVQDKKNHVIVNAMDMKMLDLQNVIAVDLDRHLLLVAGMLVILLQTDVTIVKILIMREVLLAEIVEVTIVEEVVGPAKTNIANVALPEHVVAQLHQETEAVINGLVMITQLAKATSKVRKSYPPRKFVWI